MRKIMLFFVIAYAVIIESPQAAPIGPDLFVGSSFTSEVLRFDGATGAFKGAFVSSGSGGLAVTGGFTWSPDGRFLYVGSRLSDEILRYDGVTGAFRNVFVSAGSGGLDEPNGVVIGPDGNLYVSSNATNQVVRYNGATGAFIDVFVPGPFGASIIGDLLFAPDGTLWVVSRNQAGEVINRYSSTTGGSIDAFAPGHTMDRKRAIPGPDNNVYVTSRGTDEVARFSGATGAFIDVFVSAGSGGIDGPLGSAFGPDGNLYVGGQFSDSVVRYNGATGAFIDAFVPAGTGGLDGATFLVFHAIPEPSTLILVAVGIVSVVGASWHLPKRGLRRSTS